MIPQVRIQHEAEQIRHLFVAHWTWLVMMGRAQYARLPIPCHPVEYEEVRPLYLVQRLHHVPCARAAGVDRKVHGQYLAGVCIRLLQRIVEVQRIRQRIAWHRHLGGKVAHHSATAQHFPVKLRARLGDHARPAVQTHTVEPQLHRVAGQRLRIRLPAGHRHLPLQAGHSRPLQITPHVWISSFFAIFP